MSEDQPSLAEQITALEWATAFFDASGRAAVDRMSKADRKVIERGVKAAAETLKHLEFFREALN